MDGEIITIYLPIFEEKLAKLEDSGRCNSAEAARLRRVTRQTKRGQSYSPVGEEQAAA